MTIKNIKPQLIIWVNKNFVFIKNLNKRDEKYKLQPNSGYCPTLYK